MRDDRKLGRVLLVVVVVDKEGESFNDMEYGTVELYCRSTTVDE